MGRKRIVTIDKAIVEVIVVELLLGGGTGDEDEDEDEDENEDKVSEQQEDNKQQEQQEEERAAGRLKGGNCGMQVFVKHVVAAGNDLNGGDEIVSRYTVVIVANMLQFDYCFPLCWRDGCRSVKLLALPKRTETAWDVDPRQVIHLKAKSLVLPALSVQLAFRSLRI